MDQSGRAFREAYAPEDFPLTLRHGGYMHPVWNVEARFPRFTVCPCQTDPLNTIMEPAGPQARTCPG